MRLHFKVTSPMRYFWLKKITGINLSTHCAKCLNGSYWPTVNGASLSGDIELPNGVYYLCGVSASSQWSRNFHLAFVADKHSDIIYSNNGVNVTVTGAKRITFSEKDIDANHPCSEIAAYRTCRNWQFAHWLNSNPGVYL